MRSDASLTVPSPPALDKFTAAFLNIRERQQKAAEEKKGAKLQHFSGDPDVEKARAEIEHAQEIEDCNEVTSTNLMRSAGVMAPFTRNLLDRRSPVCTAVRPAHTG